MHRTALARTHRPRRFGELVGQDHVASTLRAAVEGDRVAHAYLFSGPRGVGKTTTARVLAMALNCQRVEGGEPCGTCDSCERIWSGRADLDVVEIDAASHRGVEDARDLRERAMYAPTSERRYKVYILDEAHMLTREAWNALLKILEEPPPRVIFCFATTEPQKIERTAAPVLSRCQRFEFRRVPVPEIVARLETVLEREEVGAEAGALLAIARRAEGGVRDALSLLDQVLSFAGERVAEEDVRRMLGLVEEERYVDFLGLAAAGDRSGVFPFVQELLDAGHEPAEFVRGLAEALRAILVLEADPEAPGVELLPETRKRFLEAAEPFSEVDLLRLLLAVTDFEMSGRFRRSAQQRIQLEVLLLRLVSMDASVELRELLAAVGRGGGGSRRGRGRGDGGGGGGSARRRTPQAGPGGPAASARSGRDAGAGGAPRAEKRAQAKNAAQAEGAGQAEGSGQTEGASRVQAAWRRALDDARGLGGQAVALRGVRATECRDGTVSLRVPDGLLEDLRAFLTDRKGSAGLRKRLATELGVEPEALAFEVRQSGSPGRLTAETTRRQKLSRLMSVDPHLREAVEKLDLTLKE